MASGRGATRTWLMGGGVGRSRFFSNRRTPPPTPPRWGGEFEIKDPKMDGLTIVSHPLVQHKLTLLRDRNSSIQLFRSVVREIATLLCYEVTRELPTELIDVETPVAHTRSPSITGKKLVIAPIMRAGLQMAEGMLDLVPSARLAHVGLYRDPLSLQAVEYYFKTPEDCHERLVIVVDPMLATGHTAIAAVD